MPTKTATGSSSPSSPSAGDARAADAQGSDEDIRNATLPIEALTPHPRNYRRHPDAQIAKLEQSIARFGQVRSAVVQEGAGGRYLIVAGHGLIEAAKRQGLRSVRADVIPPTWTPAQIEGYLIADNLHADGADDDYDLLAAMLREQQEAGYLLESLGSSDDALLALLDQLETPLGEDVVAPEKGRQPNRRVLPLDCIFTINGTGALCCIAVRAGLKYGIQSAGSGTNVCLYTEKMQGHDVVFVDNDYFHYDHQQHLAVVRELRPKYATVRDIMTRTQCDAAGIDYFSLEQILAFAEELEQWAEHVILIPKYDCLDKLPARYVLGYSVPTSHGGTPLPVEAFKGRPVHLLGGSWGAQLAHMAVLGDDVVSVDNNYIQKVAGYGQFTDPDGVMHTLDELGGLSDVVTNPMYVALSLSCGNIGAKVHQLYGVEGNAHDADAADDDDDEEYITYDDDAGE